jgi:hypothetical protein
MQQLQSLHVDREQPNVPRLYLANGPCWAGLGRLEPDQAHAFTALA